MQLQSLVMNPQMEEIERLLYSKEGREIKFNGYFNLFFIEKRVKYTDIDNLYIELKLSGYEKIRVWHDYECIFEKDITDSIVMTEIPYKSYSKGVFWISLIETELEEDRKIEYGYFTTSSRNNEDINIAVDICTFKREEYVLRNLKQLSQDILEKKELDIYKHVDVVIVDNAKTLREHKGIQSLCNGAKGRIRIIENNNSGGTGGFTKGIITALENDNKYSHVLLMDDDAVIFSDALIRVYGVLCTLKSEYKNILIGGELLSEDVPWSMYAFGETFVNAEWHNEKTGTDMRVFENAASELFTACPPEFEYTGWWLNCISLEAVRECGLPFPFFIHRDDIEYSYRMEKYGIVFLNGIGVWHKRLNMALSAMNNYYDMRNGLIFLALHGNKYGAFKAAKQVFVDALYEVYFMRYSFSNLRCDGVEDFFKGPAWLAKQSAVQINTEVNKKCQRSIPVEELLNKLEKKEKAFVKSRLALKTEMFATNKHFKDKNYAMPTKNRWTLNGQILPNKKKVVVRDIFDHVETYYRAKKVVLLEPLAFKAFVFEFDAKELQRCVRRSIGAALKTLFKWRKTSANYRKYFKEMTSLEYWNEYLDRE